MNTAEFIEKYGRLWNENDCEEEDDNELVNSLVIDDDYQELIDEDDIYLESLDNEYAESPSEKSIWLELEYHPLIAIPDDVNYSALILHNCRELKELPRKLNVSLYCDMSGCSSLKQLPEEITVYDTLILSDTAIEDLPKFLFVKYGGVIAQRTPLKSIANQRKIKGNLDLRECRQLTDMPISLMVTGNLDLSYCSSLTHLPKNLIVGGSLSIRGTQISHLPEHMVVGGDLDLRDTPINSLPKRLKVNGSVNLAGCSNLANLPEDLEVNGFLNVMDTPFTGISLDLKVDGVIVTHDRKIFEKRNGVFMVIHSITDNSYDFEPHQLEMLSHNKIRPMLMKHHQFVSFNKQLYRLLYNDEHCCVSQNLDSEGITIIKKENGYYSLIQKTDELNQTGIFPYMIQLIDADKEDVSER